MSQEVQHDTEEHQFYIEMNGEKALLDYTEKDGALDFTHTYVPEELRGEGLAGKVVAAGFAYAKEKGLSVIPTCPYVKTFVKRHSEYQDIVKD